MLVYEYYKHLSHSDFSMAVALPNHACLRNTAMYTCNQDDRLQKH